MTMKKGNGTLIKKDDYFFEKLLAQCETEGECWVWQGRLNNGIPFATVNWGNHRENFAVRRFMYLRERPDTLFTNSDTIYTTCSNPMCVNPEHLAIGVGAGTALGTKVAVVLNQYKALLASGGKWNVKRASDELNISWITLRKYLDLYNSNPAYWDKLCGYVMR